jgi:hypothetical protein
MIKDFSPIDVRQRFTLRQAAAFWAGYSVATKTNSAEVRPYLDALVEAAKRGKLAVQRAQYPMRPSWTTRGLSGGGFVGWPDATVERQELKRWVEAEDVQPRPSFLYPEERGKAITPRPAGGRPRKQDDLELLAAIKRGDTHKKIENDLGHSSSTVKRAKRALKEGQK